VCVFNNYSTKKTLGQNFNMDVMCSYKKTQRKKNYEKNKKSDEKYLVFSKRINLVKKNVKKRGVSLESARERMFAPPPKNVSSHNKKKSKMTLLVGCSPSIILL